MGYAYAIAVFSRLWWECLLGSLLGIILALLVFVVLSPKNKERGSEILASFLLFDLMLYLCYRSGLGEIDMASALPLQYCSLMQIFVSIALATKRQWLYEVSLLFGVVAPFQAVITPAIAHEGLYYFLDYFISHSLLVAAPLILTYAFGMRPRMGAWWKTPLSVTPVVCVIVVANYIFDGNYMFLMSPPQVANFMTFAPWPFYIFIWVALLVFVGYLTTFCIQRASNKE